MSAVLSTGFSPVRFIRPCVGCNEALKTMKDGFHIDVLDVELSFGVCPVVLVPVAQAGWLHMGYGTDARR